MSQPQSPTHETQPEHVHESGNERIQEAPPELHATSTTMETAQQTENTPREDSWSSGSVVQLHRSPSEFRIEAASNLVGQCLNQHMRNFVHAKGTYLEMEPLPPRPPADNDEDKQNGQNDQPPPALKYCTTVSQHPHSFSFYSSSCLTEGHSW